ncbi:glycosyltransferase [Akkermansiaceae bacterium]|nr:glycosyltransferase [Akkermansiaceae bacterium]MDB4480608.1 glycosyltransferase [Akkermansiaceae bacterium]
MMSRKFGKKKGISLLIPTQNSENTIELCLRTFRGFADEIIVVDNGSTDRTKEIVREIELELDELCFFDAPHLKDLYENRQFALEKSNYNWVVRIDSDYIAYTSGASSILELRQLILSQSEGVCPLRMGISQVNLYGDLLHCGKSLDQRTGNANPFIFPPVQTLPARIIEWYPMMRFQRNRGVEGVRWQKWLRSFQLAIPYWFHCTLVNDKQLFIRSQRTPWRAHGDFSRYPALDHWIDDHLIRVGKTLEQAAAEYCQRYVTPHLEDYDEAAYYPYPDALRDELSGRSWRSIS